MAGCFITFEGGEGSGKTTIALNIKKELEKRNIECILTREPGGIDIAEQIREVILKKENTKMDPKTEALLYAAARRQHLVEKVLPALQENKVVICDRFVDSSLVYQGKGRGLGIEAVYNMNCFAIDDLMPDVTIFFDVLPEVGLSRINKDDQREVNRLDLESLDFHYRVYNGYKEIASMYPDRIQVVDASKSVEEVTNNVLDIILASYEQRTN